MPSRPWYPMYAADFIADTYQLTPEQVGAYIRLINDYWLHGPLPADDEQYLLAVTGMTKHKFRKNFAKIFSFFVRDSDKFFHRRVDKEIAKAVDISEKRREAAMVRHDANADANAEQKHPYLQLQVHKSKEKEEKEKPEPAARSTRKRGLKTEIPDLSLPDEWRDYCKTKRPDLTPDDVWENFSDYYLAHGKTMKDWSRCWQRWVRNERKVVGRVPPESDAEGLRTLAEQHGIDWKRSNSYFDLRRAISQATGMPL